MEFRLNKNGVIVPAHEPPKLHKDVMLMSFNHYASIGKTYKEVIGLRNVTHFSINIVDPDDKMSIISYNPHIAFNICRDGSYLYNGSISPTFYRCRDIYSWDEAYDPRYKKKMINNMERKNGIQKGVVLIRRLGRFVLLYSFATKYESRDFYEDISENKSFFYSAGDHCYSMIGPIYEGYSPRYGAPSLLNLGVIDGENINNNPHNKLVKPDLKIID